MQIAEGERAQQEMSLMPAGSEYHEPMTTQPYDIRNFIPMNLMEPSYARSDQTPLQLVYDPRYYALISFFSLLSDEVLMFLTG